MIAFDCQETEWWWLCCPAIAKRRVSPCLSYADVTSHYDTGIRTATVWRLSPSFKWVKTKYGTPVCFIQEQMWVANCFSWYLYKLIRWEKLEKANLYQHMWVQDCHVRDPHGSEDSLLSIVLWQRAVWESTNRRNITSVLPASSTMNAEMSVSLINPLTFWRRIFFFKF